LACVPAFLLARRAAGPRAGLFAALALALHPRHVAVSADALSEPLAGLLALCALAAGFHAAERAIAAGSKVALASAASGASAALGFLVRPDALLGGLGPLALRGAW